MIEAMNDLSAIERVVKWSEQWWANAKPEVQAHRCTAHRKSGDRCKRAAIMGGRVCTHHGGKAPQTQAKAQRRLAESADRMARELLGMATDPNVSDAVKLAAIRDALDRGGVTAKTAVELSAQPLKPYEEILRDMAGIATITRAESRARRGLTDEPPALPRPQEIKVVDAELVPPHRGRPRGLATP